MKMTVETVFKEPDVLCEATGQAGARQRLILALTLYAVAGGALYGLTMGLNRSPLQACLSAVKVPVLFLATLGISLPSLHFIGLLFGSTVELAQTFLILLAGISLTSILLGAFAPISLLFLASGSDYPFLLLMHVAVFAFCGAAGLYSIYRNFVLIRSRSPGEGKSISDHVLKVWMVLYMFVGTQTAFVLSPFIGRGSNFELFEPPAGNFYSYVWSVLMEWFR